MSMGARVHVQILTLRLLTSTKRRELRNTSKIIYRIKCSDTGIQQWKTEEKVMPRSIVIFNIYTRISTSPCVDIG